MPGKVTSTYNQREYTQDQQAAGATLRGLVEQHGDDLAALAVTLAKAGYLRDSTGQIFLHGALVPFPEMPAGVNFDGSHRPHPFNNVTVKQVVKVGAPITPKAGMAADGTPLPAQR